MAMILVRPLDGSVNYVRKEAIAIVQGPDGDDPPETSYVYGPGPQIKTLENAEVLLARVQFDPPLTRLTLPSGRPTWVKAAAIARIRVALKSDGAPTARSVVYVGGEYRAVQEDPEAIRALIDGGATAPTA